MGEGLPAAKAARSRETTQWSQGQWRPVRRSESTCSDGPCVMTTSSCTYLHIVAYIYLVLTCRLEKASRCDSSWPPNPPWSSRFSRPPPFELAVLIYERDFNLQEKLHGAPILTLYTTYTSISSILLEFTWYLNISCSKPAVPGSAMASTQPNPEGSLAHPQAPSVPTPSDSSPPQPTSGAASEVPQNLPLGLGQEQVIAILKHLPGVFSRVSVLSYFIASARVCSFHLRRDLGRKSICHIHVMGDTVTFVRLYL